MRYLCSSLAFVSLLLFGQVYGVSHAAEYGADAHHHESVPVQRYFMKTQIPHSCPQWQVACCLHAACRAFWVGVGQICQCHLGRVCGGRHGYTSIDVEAGGSGVVDAKAAEMLTEGFERILSHLGMTAKQFPAPTDQQIIFDRQSIKAPVSGSWVSVKAAGETVVAGELLGYVTDWHGRTVFEARSPKDGLLMLRLSSPPVHQGETLAVVASTKIRRE